MTPAVTAVVAAYKAGPYLREAIASALAQTYTDLEVLVSDDAADPGVSRLTTTFGDPRVRYRANPVRIGPACNHWAGLAAARGRYVAILNHDDVWRPQFLATLVPPLEADPDLALAFCDHDVIAPGGETLAEATTENTRRWGRAGLAPGTHATFRGLVVRQSIPVAMGAVFRRSVVEPADLPDVGPAYDLWLAYALARGGGGAWYTPRRLTGWRTHPTQLTQRPDQAWASGAVACWRAVAEDPGFRPLRRAVRRRLAAAALAAARSAQAGGGTAAARRFARLAVRHRPGHWKAWAVLLLSLLPQRRAAGGEGGHA